MTKNLKKQATAQFSKIAADDAALVFQRLNAMLITMSARVAEEMNFTLTEVLVCEHLRLYGPLTPRDVGERVGLSSGAVTRLLDRLEARGFTTRADHPADRRKVLMHYVEQQDATIKRPLILFEKLQQTLAHFDDTEQKTIIKFLQTMTEATEQSMTEEV
jgi:DNA-binding MarR family transcriptional regulator